MHDLAGVGNQRHPCACADEIEQGEQFPDFLHNPRRESRGVTGAKHVLVQAGGGRPGHQDEWIASAGLESVRLFRVSADGNDEPIGKERKAEDFAGLDREAHKSNVHGAVFEGFQLRGSRHFAHDNLDTGIAVTEPLDQVRETGGKGGKAKANPQQSRFSADGATGKINGKLGINKQRTGALDQDLTCASKRQAARLSNKEGATECLLDSVDLLGEGGLGDAKGLGGASEVQMLGKDDDRSHLIQIDFHNRRLSQCGQEIIGRYDPVF